MLKLGGLSCNVMSGSAWMPRPACQSCMSNELRRDSCSHSEYEHRDLLDAAFEAGDSQGDDELALRWVA